MIFGIGTDICDIGRVRRSLARHGERLAQKILCNAELQIWRQRALRSPERGASYLATRFSAKEAFSKALGLGMRRPMTWHDCEVASAASGKPEIVLHGALRQWCVSRQLRVHLSLTDELDYAASFVVVEASGSTGSAGPALVN